MRGAIQEVGEEPEVHDVHNDSTLPGDPPSHDPPETGLDPTDARIQLRGLGRDSVIRLLG